MATLISDLITRARLDLLDPASVTPNFWSSAELLQHATDGCFDLWKAIIDLYKDHIVTMDESNVTLPADTSLLSGIPVDVFRVVNLQPRIVGPSSTNPGLVFKPAELTSPQFVQAKAMRAVAPRYAVLYYAIINAGAPVGAPSITVAPQVTSAVNLALWYNPVLAARTTTGGVTPPATDYNPIPGESDKAVEAYMVAFARAREREDRSPDPEWLSIYATEKRNLLTVLTPRSIQEPEVVDSFMQWPEGVAGSGVGFGGD
jgi:hypothetical protein